MSFIKHLKRESNYTKTENWAKTNLSTKNALLDFFSMGGVLRTRGKHEVINLFQRAMIENPLLALKSLFYFRDIRGGQGERRTFRIILNWLGHNYPEIIKKNISNIPEYGRWDDLYSLVDTQVKNPVLEYILNQFQIDINEDKPSLLAKWLKSENTSSRESKRLAKIIIDAFNITSREYRKKLSELRKKIHIVERKMSLNLWDAIIYDQVPSRASMIYAKAFRKHDKLRYNDYLKSVKKGEAKINA
jgi:hypothetical protein